MAHQMSLPLKEKKRIQHGGEKHAERRKRKEERPFDPIKPLHVTMRASKATGERSMLHPKHSRKVRAVVYRAADRHGIELKSYACVGNHLHFLLQTKSRRTIPARLALRAFLREVAGLVARIVTGAKKGQPAGERFWDYLAWSRVVEWGRALATVRGYLAKNLRECVRILEANNWPSPDLPP